MESETMGLARSHARLRWEIACERLRNALSPPNGAPAATAAERAFALRAVKDSLEGLDMAFGISTLANFDATDPRALETTDLDEP